MGKWVVASVVLLAAALGAAYLWLYRPQESRLLEAQRQASENAAQVQQLKSRLADLEAVRDELQKASSELAGRVAQKEEELSSLRSTHEELMGELKQEIADRQIEVERIRDKLRVEMVDEILFDSGESALKPAGMTVLKKIGTVLARVKDRGIEIQGHTDNVAIRGALAKRFATNWELSAARATNVARFLQDEGGVDPKRLSAAAYSEYHPRDPNDTEEGRRRNRRIEILLGPLEEAKPAEKPAPPPPPGAAQPSAPPSED